jgi:hypothetical protein
MAAQWQLDQGRVGVASGVERREIKPAVMTAFPVGRGGDRMKGKVLRTVGSMPASSPGHIENNIPCQAARGKIAVQVSR